MAENTHPTPGVPAGYTAEGRELEQEALENSSYPVASAQPLPDDEAAGRALQAQSLGNGEPARVEGDVRTAAAGDSSEMLGEVLQSQELNPSEPAVTNVPAPMQPAPVSCTPTGAGYAAQGRALEQEAVAQTYPSQPIAPSPAPSSSAPYYAAAAPQAVPPSPASTSQAAYQATYGMPTTPTSASAAAPVPPVYNPQAAATAAALKKTRSAVDPRRVFLICGMAVGAIMIVFGLCMLAFYTPTEISEFYSSSHQAFGSSGATAAQVLKAGFSMLLIGLGATDICAFGSKLFKHHGCKRNER